MNNRLSGSLRDPSVIAADSGAECRSCKRLVAEVGYNEVMWCGDCEDYTAANPVGPATVVAIMCQHGSNQCRVIGGQVGVRCVCCLCSAVLEGPSLVPNKVVREGTGYPPTNHDIECLLSERLGTESKEGGD